MQNSEIMVSICMITYNHAPYIEQAINGVLMQKTNFLIELVIGEDFSTDNTRDICIHYKEKYPHKIKLLLHDTNCGMVENFLTTMESCAGKYIALCEGDDYWTDPNKLQKQIDFLESHTDYSCSMHNSSIYYQKENRFVERDLPSLLKNGEPGFTFTNADRINNWFGGTLTCVFRKKNLPNIELCRSYTEFIDLHLFYYLLKNSKGYYIKDNMAVYRYGDGVWASSTREKQLKKDELWYSELYAHEKQDDYAKKMIQQTIYNNLMYYNTAKYVQYVMLKFGIISYNPILLFITRKIKNKIKDIIGK